MEKNKLYKVWKNSFEGQNKKQIKKCFDALVLCYEEKHRHYHNLEHVQYLIDQINELELIRRDRLILIYTAFYHDVIYTPGSTQNEVKSSEFAINQLTQLKVDVSIIRSVERSILATSNHKSDNTLTQLFLDIDLSILAASAVRYKKYSKAIKMENIAFPACLYQFNRKRFIQKTLKKSQIFLTDLYLSRYELLARKNLINELNQF